ncbi:MAG TPA: radical SAM protein [Thermoguttaceae bacterium]|nr:radical SAM protein [Thermoguttaceae bacterium]
MGSEVRTVLIHSPCYELQDDRLEPPLGLLYLATWLHHHGYPAAVVDLSSTLLPDGLQRIPPAAVYGFSTYTATYGRTLQIVSHLRAADPLARMVAGGPHATALPEEVERDFDHVVVGEGERALLRIVKAIEAGQSVPRVLREPVIENLDSLPFPDYRLVDLKSYHRVVGGRRCVSVLTTRGCPYQCVFCNSVVMGHSEQVRFRSAQHVVAEIQELKHRWGIAAFRFQDDTFTLDASRIEVLTGLLRRENILYRCFGRVDQCSRRVTDQLYASGCRHVAFGVESGSSQILERMMKGHTVDEIRTGIANAKASGLRVRVFLLVGFPGETWQTVQATVELMLECLPHEFVVYPVIPYPGTALYRQPERFGITHVSRHFPDYFQVAKGRRCGYVFRTADLDESKIEAMRKHVISQLEPAIRWAGGSRNYC